MNCCIRVETFLFLGSLTLAVCAAIQKFPCQERERQALLIFKQHLTDTPNRLASWVDDENCCNWAGIVCDNFTGHVVQLRLKNPAPVPRFTPERQFYEQSKLGGYINDSLLNLKHLLYLDLSCNDFGGLSIPKFIGSFKSLRYLDLSNSGFVGMLPHQLGNLSNLRYLNLRSEKNQNYLFVDNMQWLSGLSFLQYLDMSSINLGNASDWLQVMSDLPSLIELQLSSCNLFHFPKLSFVNFSSLVTLDLSDNQFNNSFFIPKQFSTLGSLEFLDLKHCNIHGPVPDALQNFTSLNHLDLSENPFNSTLPSWFFSFANLETLVLGSSDFHIRTSDSIGNLTSLVSLDMSGNHLEGEVPRSLGNLCKLQDLNLNDIRINQNISQVLETLSGCAAVRLKSLSLSRCQLSGNLNELGQFKNLEELHLSVNTISGPISTLGLLMSLEILFLDSNSFVDNVSESLFSNLTGLKTLYVSENSLTFTASSNWVPPFQLEWLGLSSCHLGPKFPLWLRSQKDLKYLDISFAGITDTIPAWFWTLSPFHHVNFSNNNFYGKLSDQILFNGFESDFSSNQFEGPLPLLSSDVSLLDLSNNSFSGSISQFLCYKMDEPKKLRILHLGDNQLSGEIPDCWMNWKSLESIQLQSNNLTGHLPNSFGSLSHLQWLHLRNNSLTGKMPLSLQDCTQLLVIDLSENKFLGNIPSWTGERLSDAMIISLRSNNFSSDIPDELCALRKLKILDLANNNLSGKIPSCVINFNAMSKTGEADGDMLSSPGSLFLGGGGYIENAILVVKGMALKYTTTLFLVKVIDLSNNNLSGEIPAGITGLLNLNSLNLSRNSLTGRIPEDLGSMGKLESIDFSSNRLYGEIPPSMAKMSFLSFLNLSLNNLSGRIPTSTQLQSLNASSFVGNNLCGPPLSEACSTNAATWISREENENWEMEQHRIDWFSLSLTLGFVAGFWGVVGPLLYSKSWRSSYFQWLDRVWCKNYA